MGHQSLLPATHVLMNKHKLEMQKPGSTGDINVRTRMTAEITINLRWIITLGMLTFTRVAQQQHILNDKIVSYNKPKTPTQISKNLLKDE